MTTTTLLQPTTTVCAEHKLEGDDALVMYYIRPGVFCVVIEAGEGQPDASEGDQLDQLFRGDAASALKVFADARWADMHHFVVPPL
jgi:hypothetical protein